MSQQDQHLTTEQLSTFLDKQLTPEEQAAYNAHLVDCEQCQHTLDDLQLTVNLLQSLPQLEVPRSFALPGDFKIVPDSNLYDDNGIDYKVETQGHENAQAIKNKKSSTRKLPTPLRRTLKTVSALAAVVGIFFALSGFIATLSLLHMGGGMGSSASTASAPTSSSADQSTSPSVIGSQSQLHQPARGSSSTTGNDSDATITANQSPTTVRQPSSSDKAAGQPNSPTNATNSAATWLPLIDFNQPGIRLSIGILLAILGGMGYRLFTRQQR